VGAGLLDAYTLLGDLTALRVLERLATFLLQWGQDLIRTRGTASWFEQVPNSLSGSETPLSPLVVVKLVKLVKLLLKFVNS
jgi:hypothetical protein